MKKERANYLYNKYLKNELTANERLEWEDLGLDLNNDHLFQELVDGLWDVKDDDVPEMKTAHADQIEQHIIAQPEPLIVGQRVDKNRLWTRIVAAAAILLIVTAGLLYYTNITNDQKLPSGAQYANDIDPGKQGATLTLANGKKIRIDQAASGEIAKESGISISKTADGQIVYEIKSKEFDPNKINTLNTEKGETYILTLPDKSKVWLNAASSLTYTAALMERGVRRVKLTGEAYFEIFKDKTHPFVVESKGQQVEVLGTHFNINAYEDEAVVKTTLLKGSVKISNAVSGPSILKPGQQAVLSDRGIVLKNVEAEDAIDWKSGYFMFNNESLESGLKRIARWYNVQIVYEDESLKGETFFGRISKFEKISKVFSMLERTDIVRFKIESNKIFVRKKK